MPHWVAPAEANASCRAFSLHFSAKPSMVSTSAPAICSTGTRQLLTSWPLTSTEQAPHSPSPQPSLAPVRPHSRRSTSSKRSIGKTSTSRGAPLTRNSILTLGNARLFKKHFGQERNLVHFDTEGVFDGVQDRGRWAVNGQFADAFRSQRSMLIRSFFKKDANSRHVYRCGHDVVGHLAVGHAAVLPHNILENSVSDALRHAAFDLSGGENGVNNAADFLKRDEIVHADLEGGCVHGHFCNVHRPRERAISIATVGVVIPIDPRWGLVLAERLERPELRDVPGAGVCEIVTGVA